MDLTSEETEDIIMSIMGFFIFLIYMFIIVILLSTARFRRKKSNQLLLNLGIGHVITGASHFTGMWTTFPIGKFVFVGIMYANVSLIALSIDRCIYIVRPFRYSLLRRGWHVIFMLASPVTAIMMLTQHMISGFDEYVHKGALSKVPFIVYVFLTTVSLIGPNLVVFVIVRKQSTRIRAQNHSIISKDEKQKSRVRVIGKRQEMRSFYLCFGCVITFIMSWLPLLTLKIIEMTTGRSFSYRYTGGAAIIANINLFTDAWFCVWYNKELRKRLKGVFKGSPETPPTTSVNLE